MGRVVLSLPVPALEEVGADPLVLEIEDIRSGVLSEREREGSEERIASTHS